MHNNLAHLLTDAFPREGKEIKFDIVNNAFIDTPRITRIRGFTYVILRGVKFG